MSEYYCTKNELYHHGIKGQKWGIRRFQNPDGSLTTAGREHYGYGKKAYSRAEWKNVKKEMRAKSGEYAERFNKHNAAEKAKLEKNLERKKQLYEKAHLENKDYKGRGDGLGDLIYESNTKRQKNAYVKAASEMAAFKNKGSDYVKKQMKKEFGQDYDDWVKEVDTKVGVATTAALLAMYGSMAYAFYKVYGGN